MNRTMPSIQEEEVDNTSSLATPEVVFNYDAEIVNFRRNSAQEAMDSPLDPSLPLNDESVLPPANLQFDDQPEHEASSRLLVVTPTFDNHKPGPKVHHSQSAISVAAPPSVVNSEGALTGVRGGFTLRNYEEEIATLRRDNLSLKLRVYFLEEKQGMYNVPEEKENVFKINLDLKVQNETMKKELEDKKNLLRAAYEAMEEQESEFLRERHEMESKLESLKQTVLESQFSITSTAESAFPEKPGNAKPDDQVFEETNSDNVGDKTRGLLYNAFGSLGSETDVPSPLQEQVKELEEQIAQERNQAKEKEEELKKRVETFASMSESLKSQINELQKQIDDKEQRVLDAQEDMKRIQAAVEHKAVENEKNKNLLQTIRHEYESKMKLQSSELQALKTKLTNAETISRTSQNFVSDMMETNKSQLSEIEKLEKEIKLRDMALEKLTKEYDVLKTKMRSYKSERQNLSQQDDNSHRSMVGKLISELDEVRGREAILTSELEQMKNMPPPSPSPFTDEMRDKLENENARLRTELSRYKSLASKAGAKVALQKAKLAYSSAAKHFEEDITKMLHLLRQRVTELVDFLQKFLSVDAVMMNNSSIISDSFKDMLQKSIDEGRRLTQSLSMSRLSEENEADMTQYIETPESWPKFELPKIDLESLEVIEPDMVDLQDYKAIVMELKDNVNLRIEAQQECEKLRKELQKYSEKQNVEEIQLRCRVPLAEVNHSRAMQTSMNTSQSCDCKLRIQELERLLQETRELYDDAQNRILQEAKRREKMERRAKYELKKTVTVLEQTKFKSGKEN